MRVNAQAGGLFSTLRCWNSLAELREASYSISIFFLAHSHEHIEIVKKYEQEMHLFINLAFLIFHSFLFDPSIIPAPNKRQDIIMW